jgi:hypothetical protein
MNFKKNFTKYFTSILNRSKWSISRLIMSKQACFAWKTQDFSHEKRHSQSWMTIVIFTMFFRFECDHAKSHHRRWLNQLTQKSKNEARKFIRKKNSIKKCFSHSMNSLFNYWNNNLRRRIMLRFRFQYEYVTFNHFIVALNQTSLLDNFNNSSINRIFRFIDHAQILNERIKKWTKNLKRKFYWTIHEKIHFMIFTSRSENDIKTTSKRIEIDIEVLHLVNRKIQIDLDIS